MSEPLRPAKRDRIEAVRLAIRILQRVRDDEDTLVIDGDGVAQLASALLAYVIGAGHRHVLGGDASGWTYAFGVEMREIRAELQLAGLAGFNPDE